MSPDSVGHMLHRMLRRAGLPKIRFHDLRHTYGIMMAEMNTPTHLLCNQVGHGNIRVTQRYYIALFRTGVDILKDNLNRL